MCGQGSYCVSYENGCCCGCSCGCYGNYGHHHYRHHESRMGAGAGIESLVPLMDIDEEIRMLEEYKDALTKQLEMVNKRLGRLKS